jgi:hypothetical protein
MASEIAALSASDVLEACIMNSNRSAREQAK